MAPSMYSSFPSFAGFDGASRIGMEPWVFSRVQTTDGQADSGLVEGLFPLSSLACAQRFYPIVMNKCLKDCDGNNRGNQLRAGKPSNTHYHV
jgi:hypothetical protein